MKENLNSRLFELLTTKGLSVNEAAKEIGISSNLFYIWQEDNISLNSLEKVANYFRCSFEFLLGRSDDVLPFTPHSPLPNFGFRLVEVFKECGKSFYLFTRTTKFQYAHLKFWKEGSLPTIPNLILIADYLEITVDYLTGRDQ